MRKLTDHIVEGDACNHQVSVTVMDAPGQGGACHEYLVDTDSIGGHGKSLHPTTIYFQNGPIKEFGINGLTQEVLIVIVMDRLRSFQAGPFACRANALALTHCENALYHLQTRTRERIARGVEGTTQK